MLINISNHLWPALLSKENQSYKKQNTLTALWVSSIWELTWAFSWSGIPSRRLWVCISTQDENMLCEWMQCQQQYSTFPQQPLSRRSDYSSGPSHWLIVGSVCGYSLGVNGNQQHIHTSSSPELKLWLSEHLSDHLEIANSHSRSPLFLFPSLALFQISPPQLELHYRVSLCVMSHSQGEGINKQTSHGQRGGSLSPRSKEMLSLGVVCVCFLPPWKTCMLDIQ